MMVGVLGFLFGILMLWSMLEDMFTLRHNNRQVGLGRKYNDLVKKYNIRQLLKKNLGKK
ncbi:hypothetical protein QM201_25915 [Enterobacter asburiae]|nr:hypothetical protein [Enterobacter asburiae]